MTKPRQALNSVYQNAKIPTDMNCPFAMLRVHLATFIVNIQIADRLNVDNKLSRSAFFDEKSIPFHKQFPCSSEIFLPLLT
jgi:hypothetical protein